jgi:hypothetical protein
MKATLKYNLPEEETEFQNAVNGTNWYLVAWRMHQYLWKLNHDGAKSTTDADIKELCEIMNEYGVSLDS